MSASELVTLFRSKDVDGSGTLDMQEFVELVQESDLLNHRAAILQQGEAIKAERQKEADQEAAQRAQAMWRMSRAGSSPYLHIRMAMVASGDGSVGGRRVSPW